MRRTSGLRILVAMAFALSSLVVMAAPAAAEIVLIPCNGTCGYYEVKDQGPTGPKGAVCVYSNSTGAPLREMTVRPPLMHGNYPNKTKIGWRFKIQREAPSSLNFNTIYTSSYQTALADDAIPAYAGHGFSRRAWRAPSNPSGFYRVWIEMQWWHNGSVEGFARVQYDWYKAIRSGYPSYVDQSYCLSNY